MTKGVRVENKCPSAIHRRARQGLEKAGEMLKAVIRQTDRQTVKQRETDSFKHC